MGKCLFVFCLLFASVLYAQDWQSSYTEALAGAKEQNKPLLLVFSGSDWCAPCKKLDKEVWCSKAFRKHAQKDLVLYKADFPRKKSNRLPEDMAAQNNMLAEQYNPKGYFPLVVLLDAKGSVLGEMGYRKETPEQYIEHLKSYLR